MLSIYNISFVYFMSSNPTATPTAPEMSAAGMACRVFVTPTEPSQQYSVSVPSTTLRRRRLLSDLAVEEYV